MDLLRHLERACKNLDYPFVFVTNKDLDCHGRKGQVLYAWWVTKADYERHTPLTDYLGRGSKLHMQVCLDWEKCGEPEFVELTEDDVCLITTRG